METNYVFKIGFFLLLVAVDFSTADSEGNLNQVTGLDHQNVDVTVNPVKNNVLEDVGHQVKDVKGGIQSNTNQGNLKQLSGSNEGEDLRKVGEESNDKTTEKMDGGRGGDNVHTSQEEPNVDDKQTAAGEKQGYHVPTGQEESNVDTKQKTDGDNVHMGQEKQNVDAKQKTDGQKQGKDVHTGQGVTEHTRGEEQNFKAKKDADNEKQSDNVYMDQEELNADAKQKTSEEHNDKVHMGREKPNAEAKRMIGGDKLGDNLHKDQDKSTINTGGKQYGEKKENLGDRVTKGKDNAADSLPQPPPPPPTRTDGFRGEECDSSNMCMDKNKRFAACLRVPGNESPELSLLIQNKGKGRLTIKISAPSFVQLGETLVGLQEKEDKEVKVSIKDYGTGNLIVLKDGIGECSLDFKDFVVHGSANSYINALSQTPTTILIFVAAILILASGWVCLSLKRKRFARSRLKYQKLDMELPVSAKVKSEPNVNDEWDNSWGDNWDVEEAPMSKPVTPSLSSKGLASRRLSKEGWKD